MWFQTQRLSRDFFITPALPLRQAEMAYFISESFTKKDFPRRSISVKPGPREEPIGAHLGWAEGQVLREEPGLRVPTWDISSSPTAVRVRGGWAGVDFGRQESFRAEARGLGLPDWDRGPGGKQRQIHSVPSSPAAPAYDTSFRAAPRS